MRSNPTGLFAATAAGTGPVDRPLKATLTRRGGVTIDVTGRVTLSAPNVFGGGSANTFQASYDGAFDTFLRPFRNVSPDDVVGALSQLGGWIGAFGQNGPLA